MLFIWHVLSSDMAHLVHLNLGTVLPTGISSYQISKN